MSMKVPPPNQNDWNHLPFEIQLCIALRLYFVVNVPCLFEKLYCFLHRDDIWLFPSLAGLSTYIVAERYIPPNPAKPFAVLSIALVPPYIVELLLIRFSEHSPTDWVRYSGKLLPHPVNLSIFTTAIYAFSLAIFYLAFSMPPFYGAFLVALYDAAMLLIFKPWRVVIRIFVRAP